MVNTIIFYLARCPTPKVQAGTKFSPWTSAKEVSPPRASINNSPFNEKPMEKRLYLWENKQNILLIYMVNVRVYLTQKID